MAKQRVQEAMTSNPTTVEQSQSVVEAARIMRSEDVGAVPVVEDGRLLGMVTDRDIALRVVAEGKDADQTTVGEIQSRDIVTVTPDQDLDEALAQMARNKVRRLPVVDGGRLVGVIAQADVARTADEEKTGEVVEQISQPG